MELEFGTKCQMKQQLSTAINKGEKMSKNIAEKIELKNKAPMVMTKNAQTYPTGITKDDIETQNYYNLIKKNVYDRLWNIAVRMYKWTLPEGMNERYIEKGFLERGWITVFKSPFGNFALPSFPNNMYNIYEEPTQMQVLGYNGYTETVDIIYYVEYPKVNGFSLQPTKKGYVGVCERDNYRGKVYRDYIYEYTIRLTNNLIALDVATERLKDPFIFAAQDKAIKKQMQKLVKNIKNNNPDILIINENIKDLGNFKIDNLMTKIDLHGNPESCKKLLEVYNANINRFLEIMGINANPDPDKTQYVNDSQVNTNNSLIDLEQDIRFLSRKNLCKKAKDLLNIEMSVEKNIVETSRMVNELKGVAEDESIRVEQQTE